MDIKETVKSRRSIRGFLEDPVPTETIKELIAESLWAPSWGNTQPWGIVVASGPALESFKDENMKAFLSGKKPDPDVPMPESWPDVNKKRYVEVGRSVLSSLSIGRDDYEERTRYYAGMFSLFGAPALLLVTIDKLLMLEYAMLDVGLFLQTFFILAHNKGLGTIALAASVNYPEIIRRIFNVGENKRIVIGAALGWPDKNNPVNNFQRRRAPLDEFVRWVS